MVLSFRPRPRCSVMHHKGFVSPSVRAHSVTLWLTSSSTRLNELQYYTQNLYAVAKNYMQKAGHGISVNVGSAGRAAVQPYCMLHDYGTRGSNAVTSCNVITSYEVTFGSSSHFLSHKAAGICGHSQQQLGWNHPSFHHFYIVSGLHKQWKQCEFSGGYSCMICSTLYKSPG